MKELLKLAEEKGWKASTLSTKWTVDSLLERRKRAFLNKYCESNVLNEIQKWLREVHDIYVEPLIDPFAGDFWYTLKAFKRNREKAYKNDLSNNNYNTYEEALEFGINEALKLIK